MARVPTGEATEQGEVAHRRGRGVGGEDGVARGPSLSFETLVRLWAMESRPWVKRHVFRKDPDGPHVDPLTHRSLLSEDALAAIARRGGGATVLAEAPAAAPAQSGDRPCRAVQGG